MDNEPVAWKVIETDDDGSFTTFTENEPVWADNAIPLYTHPVKELTLTDDEVEEFEWVLKKHFNFPTNEKVPNLDRIIRAILRKAQEK